MVSARVMVVEDEAPIAMYMCGLLRSEGYEVCDFATDDVSAYRLAEDFKPDLALMDIRLYGSASDGIDVANRLRFDFGIPSVFVTALKDLKTEERAQRTRPLDYLLKPIREESLQRCVKQALLQAEAEKLVQAVAAETGKFNVDWRAVRTGIRACIFGKWQSRVVDAVDCIDRVLAKNPFAEENLQYGVRNDSVNVFTRILEKNPVRVTCEVHGSDVVLTKFELLS